MKTTLENSTSEFKSEMMEMATVAMFNIPPYVIPSLEKQKEAARVAEVETLSFKDDKDDETLDILTLDGKLIAAFDRLNGVKAMYYEESEIEALKSQF